MVPSERAVHIGKAPLGLLRSLQIRLILSAFQFLLLSDILADSVLTPYLGVSSYGRNSPSAPS